MLHYIYTHLGFFGTVLLGIVLLFWAKNSLLGKIALVLLIFVFFRNPQLLSDTDAPIGGAAGNFVQIGQIMVRANDKELVCLQRSADQLSSNDGMLASANHACTSAWTRSEQQCMNAPKPVGVMPDGKLTYCEAQADRPALADCLTRTLRNGGDAGNYAVQSCSQSGTITLMQQIAGWLGIR
jgi:hypothetical protein